MKNRLTIALLGLAFLTAAIPALGAAEEDAEALIGRVAFLVWTLGVFIHISALQPDRPSPLSGNGRSRPEMIGKSPGCPMLGMS